MSTQSRMIAMKICKVNDCGSQVHSLELCRRHYRRFKKYGDPEVNGIKLICIICGRGFISPVVTSNNCSIDCKRVRSLQIQRDWTKNNKAKIKIYSRNNYTKNSEKIKVYVKKWTDNKKSINPDFHKERIRKARYNLTQIEYLEMLDRQSNRCCICNIEFKSKPTTSKPYVDHDHNSGLVRGLLCHSCNLVLGYCKDDEKILINAIEYLEKHV